MSLISSFDILRELIGDPMNNGEALEIIKEQREYSYIRLQNCKKSTTGFDYNLLVKQTREVLAYDILIDSFEKYLNH